MSGRHTGRTDIELTATGERDARALAPMVRARTVSRALCSPLTRARRTAELAGLDTETEPDLMEWDYGGYEGLTTAQIRELRGDPTWSVMRDGVIPGDTPGETIEEVAARAARVLGEVEDDLQRGDVVLVAHGHLLRVLTATWLRQEPRLAGQLLLDAGGVCILRRDKDGPAIERWNQRP